MLNRKRAVRMPFEHQAEYDSQCAAMNSIAVKSGCAAEALRKWVRQTEYDQGLPAGLIGLDCDRHKVLERENCEL
jgi:transposase-like protein